MTAIPSLRPALLAAMLLTLSVSTLEAHCVQRRAWMITQTVCVYCDRARNFFARNGVPFIEYNIDDHSVWRWNVGDMPVGTIRQFAQNRYGWVATPIIEIDDVVIRGFLLESLQKETCTYD
jgi:glutaredoxin